MLPSVDGRLLKLPRTTSIHLLRDEEAVLPASFTCSEGVVAGAVSDLAQLTKNQELSRVTGAIIVSTCALDG